MTPVTIEHQIFFYIVMFIPSSSGFQKAGHEIKLFPNKEFSSAKKCISRSRTPLNYLRPPSLLTISLI